MSGKPGRHGKTKVIRRKIFTLIELLVVVSITMILLSVLLPALSKAREATRRTLCASNQRQISMGFQMYVDEHMGFLPAYLDFGGWWWDYNRVGKYFNKKSLEDYYPCKKADLFRCPSDQSTYPYSYGMYWKLSSLKAASLQYPARTFLLADANIYFLGNIPIDQAEKRHNLYFNILFLDGHVSIARDFEGLVFIQ